MAAMALGTTIQNGHPKAVRKAKPRNAPSIINSPWQKLTASLAL